MDTLLAFASAFQSITTCQLEEFYTGEWAKYMPHDGLEEEENDDDDDDDNDDNNEAWDDESNNDGAWFPVVQEEDEDQNDNSEEWRVKSPEDIAKRKRNSICC